MARQLKRWESPRKEGRNDKGRGGSARQRQVKKQMQMLRKKLKENGSNTKGGKPHKKGENLILSFFCAENSLVKIQLLCGNLG